MSRKENGGAVYKDIKNFQTLPSPTLTLKYLKRKNLYDEKRYFGDHGRAFKVRREEWECVCGGIFPKAPPSKAFVADSDVRHSNPEMLTFFLPWQELCIIEGC